MPGLVPGIPLREACAHLSGMAGTSPAMTAVMTDQADYQPRSATTVLLSARMSAITTLAPALVR